MFKKIFTFFITLFITSCSSNISNFNSYQKEPFPRTTFMPDAQMLEGQPPKIVIFKLDEGLENKVAKQAGLGEAMAINIENILTKNHLAELVDRKAAVKLKKEIILAELNHTGSYKGPKIADYALSGSISNASFTKKYTSARTTVNFEGHLVRLPPKFTYISEVNGNIKIYELPSMSVAANLEFKEKEISSENVQADNNISVLGLVEFGGQQAEGRNRDDGLVRKTGEEAIDSIAYQIKNFFAKKGYILEKRSLNKKSVFKISLGSNDGIKKKDKFEIIGKYEIENPITGKSEIEQRIITTGKVSNKINPKSSWVTIDDKKAIQTIRLGDMVQFKYKRSFFDQATKIAEDFIPN